MSWNEAPWEPPAEESGGQLPAFLMDPLGVLRRRWLPAVAALALGLVVTVVATAFWKPVYVAQSTLLITSQQIPKEFVRSTVEEGSLAYINAMLGKVLSVQNLSRLIEEHGLFPNAGRKATRRDLVNAMRSRIDAAPASSLSYNSSAIVFEISYESALPEEAALVSNALAALFVESSIERRNDQARRVTAFLRNELERNDKELREVTRQISDYRRAHRGKLPDEQETNLRKVDLLAQQRESLSQQIAAKEDRILSISSQSGDATLSEDGVLLNELRRELARQSAAHTDEHPNVIALRDRIRLLEQKVSASSGLSPNTDRIVAAERREIGRLRDQRARIDAEIVDLNRRIDQTPLIGEELAALESKEKVLREDYVESLRKVQEAELAESLESAQQGGQVSILDRASPPSAPKLSRWMVALGGLGASLALALGLAVLLELVDPVLVGQSQLEQLSEGPVLGSVPYVA